MIENGYNGFLIDVGDYRALSKYILNLLEDKSIIKTMGENLYNSVEEKFSSDKMVKDHIKTYNEILKNRRQKIMKIINEKENYLE